MTEANIPDIKDDLQKLIGEHILPAVFVHEKISQIAGLYPYETAVNCDGKTLSYHQLEILSNKLAHYLIKKGIRPESTVGICMEPGILLAVVILGILKSGGAYIHLAPSLPVSRITTILDDASAQLLITSPAVSGQLSAVGTPEINYSLQQWESMEEREDLPIIKLAPHNAAYVLYTSGSTGKPKGVVIEHRNLTYYLNWTTGEFANAIGARIPLTSSMSFAAGVTQFYSALLKGYTLYILPPDIIRQPAEILKWYTAHPGYALYCVPTLWNEILNWLAQHNGPKLSGPDCIILSGEAVGEKLVQWTYELLPKIKAWNLYGPTEAVANLSGGLLQPGVKISIGDPLPGTKLFIVKENGAEALPGETGELMASGNGIARGYLGREDITARTFITYHSSHFGSIRVYRTGDLVKLQDDGTIVYVGRNDQQVKINGYRIELMEVELALKQMDIVQQAVVKAIETGVNEKTLVAYIIPAGRAVTSISVLRKALAETLPDYMLPGRWVIMDEFPTLANGKIDRGRLPLPGDPRPDLGYAAILAGTADERKMVHIFEKVLGFSSIGMDDNFFDLGGTSLKINAIIGEVRQVFGAVITYRDFFTNPTPKKLLRALDEAPVEHVRSSVATATLPGTDSVSLAPNQTGLWFVSQLNKNSVAYNIPYAINLRGTLDINCLQLALQAVIDRHVSLRSSVIVVDGLPKLHVNPYLHVDIEQVDLSFMSAGESLKSAQDAIELTATKPFDLLTAPLFRVQLYKTGKDAWLLGLVIHHIIFDGWSVNIFYRELLANYAAILNGSAPELVPLQASYLDFALEYENYSASGALQQARTFWKQQLHRTSNHFIFPHDFTAAPDKNEDGGRVAFTLNARLKEQLSALNKQHGVTPYISLMSAFMLLVYRYNKQADILIATAVANRRHLSFYPLTGYFTNTILVRAGLTGEMTFADLLVHVKNVCLESFEYEQMPYSEQIRILHEQGCVVHPSGVEIMFAYHEAFETVKSPELQSEVQELFNRNAKFPLFLECQDEADGIRVSMTYDKHLYHEQSIIQLMVQYVNLLNGIVDNATLPVEHYPLQKVSGNPRQLTIQAGNRKKLSGPMLLHKLFELAVDTYSDLVAIRQNGAAITYKQIDEQANRLAWHMMAQGIKAYEPVGIFMDHSATMIAAMLAVMKIGAHYVPLDPDYPAKRNVYVIEHSRLQAIITDSKHGDKIPQVVPVIISADEFLKSDNSNKNERPDCTTIVPGDLLYIMYTSGSTGNPKGVMVPHKGVCNYLLWMKAQFDIDTKDNILAKTSISFDVSVWELFLPLIAGGKLILNDRLLMKVPEQIAQVIKTEEVNIIQFVPSGLRAFTDAGVLKECTTLKKIFCGGEKLPVQLQHDVFKQFKGELHNLYGPTEASIFVCHYQCSRSDTYRTVPIGKPVFNSGICVLDEHLDPVPAGCVGDIYIYGDVLATGYIYNEMQTKASFINYPDENNIIYKTGDKGRRLYDGNIEFHGRADHQVKVRGYRIEMGEIEQVILRYPGVSHAIVIRKEHSESDVRLIAYFVVNMGVGINEQDLRQYMRHNLPEYMLPSNYYFVDHIPVLPNGKTDNHTLEATATSVKMEHRMPTEHFRDDIEKVLAKIWAEVLGRDDFKPTDNFMDAGGHSILLAKVCSLINERLDQNYSLIDLFQYPSIESFAKFYRERFLNAPKGNSIIQDRIAKRKNKLNELKKRNN